MRLSVTLAICIAPFLSTTSAALTSPVEFSCVGSWKGAVPVMIKLEDGKAFQNGVEMQDVKIGEESVTYSKLDGAEIFVTTINFASGKLMISVMEAPRKEEKAFLEGKCKRQE